MLYDNIVKVNKLLFISSQKNFMDLKKNKSKLNILHLIVGLGDGGAEATLYKLVSNDNTNNHVVISLSDFGKYGELFQKSTYQFYAFNFRRNRFNLLQIFKLLNKIETI